jgi:uncharacterized protein (TIGR02118 family)
MKVLLTVGFDGDRDEFAKAMQAELSNLVARGGAQRGALDVRADGDELDAVRELDTEHDAAAMVSLWEPESPSAALELALPDGSRLVGGYEVQEVVQREYERTWPAGEASPGVKIVCLVQRRPDLSQEAYSEHWRERHGPLALAHQPGFWHYVQNHVVSRLTDSTPEFHGIGELHFRSTDAVHDGMFDSDEGARLIWEDTERFMSHEGSTTLPTKEYLVP